MKILLQPSLESSIGQQEKEGCQVCARLPRVFECVRAGLQQLAKQTLQDVGQRVRRSGADC